MADFIQQKIRELIKLHTTASEWEWLEQKAASTPLDLMTAFVAAPRFLSKKIITSDTRVEEPSDTRIPGFNVEGWSLVRLSRVWLLTQLDDSDKKTYVNHIETLFDTAELNELVALYSALPLLSYPEQWLHRATDAVRSNMGFVFDAIALHNSYPERYFSEAAWNQLVLKTIFNDKPINLIEGLTTRANPELAMTLSDFAHERWAAGRTVPPRVWQLISPFLNNELLQDLAYLFKSTRPADQQAAAIAAFESGFEPALQLLSGYPDLQKQLNSGSLTWASLD